MSDKKKFETLAIHTATEQSSHREHVSPIFMTSSFTFENAEQAHAMFAGEEDGLIYTRFSNPNNDELVKKLCLLENTEDGMVVASGMAAMFVSMAAFLKKGDHLLISRSIFGSTHQVVTQIFPKWGIAHTYVDIHNPDSWETSIQKNTKMIFLETPSNPALEIIDLEWVGKLAQKYKLILNVDNCFATPYLQRPAEFGAQLVTHSATKWIDGQGRTIAGVVLGTKELIEEVRFMVRHTGPSLSPFNAWLLSRSLETLSIRMDRHCQNALELAKWLEGLDEVEWVKYPFLPSHPEYELAKKQMKLGGGIVTFGTKKGVENGRRFLNNLKIISHTANLGDSRTIATHPYSTTHSKLSDEEKEAVGIVPELIRMSVGLENMEDIKTDILTALKH